MLEHQVSEKQVQLNAVQGRRALCFRPGEVRAMAIRTEAFIFTTCLPEGRILNPVLSEVPQADTFAKRMLQKNNS